MAVDVAYDGDEGFGKATTTRYDVVVLDRDLPGKSGDEICRSLTDEGVLTRVIMLTASAAIEDKVEGLALGADDYLAKPFAFAELVARVRALARRATPATPPVLVAADVELDPAKRTVMRSGQLVDLTRKEFGVLEVLMAAGGTVVSVLALMLHQAAAQVELMTGRPAPVPAMRAALDAAVRARSEKPPTPAGA